MGRRCYELKKVCVRVVIIHHFQQRVHQLGVVSYPASRGQLNREKLFSLALFATEKLWSRKLGSASPSHVSLFIVYTRWNEFRF